MSGPLASDPGMKDQQLLKDLTSSREFEFVGLVGLQPSETPVKLRALRKLGVHVARVTLLHTEKTSEQARRIEAWCQLNGFLCGPVPMGQVGGDPDVNLEEALGRGLGDRQGPILCNADPGLSALLGQLFQLLNHKRLEVVYVHSDSDNLYLVQEIGDQEHWYSTDLEDLGMNPLLDLYDLVAKSAPERIRDWDLAKIIRAASVNRSGKALVGMQIVNAPPPILALAYERRGVLYGLCEVPGDGGDASSGVKQIVSLSAGWTLNHLRPFLWGWTRKKNERAHLEKGRCGSFSSLPGDHLALNAWMAGNPGVPGESFHSVPLAPPSGDPGPRPDAQTALLVCLGKEPFATLSSLATHRPHHAWIAYDQQSAAVVDLADRFLKHKQGLRTRLGLQTITFVPTDRHGQGLHRWASQELEKFQGQLVVDLTPGTKGQTRALATLEWGDKWAMDTRHDKAFEIGGKRASTPILPPPLSLAVAIGAPHGVRQPKKLKTKHYEFYKALGSFYLKALSTTPVPMDGFPGDRNQPDGPWNVPGGSLSVEYGKVILAYNGRNLEQSRTALHKNPFEELTAHMIVQAEITGYQVSEVLLEVQGLFPEGLRHPRGGHMDDIDVVAQVGHRFLAFECKSGVNVRVPRTQRKIHATAFGALGRRAIPIVALATCFRTQVEATWDKDSGPAQLTLEDLMNPSLGEILGRILKARSTTA